MNILNNKRHIITLIICLALPFLITSIATLLTSSNEVYESFNSPAFAPPSIVFPIVWTILYILMGISSYIVHTNTTATDKQRKKALTVYIVQLILNAIWPIIFFNLELFLLAYFLILIMIVLVIWMIYLFNNISHISAYLQIPYLLWLGFASILNISIYFLN